MTTKTIPLEYTPLFARLARKHGVLRDLVPSTLPLGQVEPIEKPAFAPLHHTVRAYPWPLAESRQ